MSTDSIRKGKYFYGSFYQPKIIFFALRNYLSSLSCYYQIVGSIIEKNVFCKAECCHYIS